MNVKFKIFFSWFAIFAMGISLISVLGSYGYWWLSFTRGPSVIYFFVALAAALYFERKALVLVIFLFPLIPTLHTQLEILLHPPVKYFISYPGVDLVVGLCIGLYIRHIYKLKTWRVDACYAPWPFGLLLFILTISTALAVSRNLWQSASQFSFYELSNNILRFKVMEKSNNYAAVEDLLVYTIAALIALVTLKIVKNEQNKDEYIFKPVIWGVIISACWGILQSQTSWGLTDFTKGYRPEDFGFGSEGFQPDIHAFAGHMLIGAVGLLGYVVYIANGQMRYLAVFASLLSWVAIVLSKSRASLVFAVAFTLIFVLFFLKNRKNKLSKNLLFLLSLLAIVVISAFFVSYYVWLGDFFDALNNSKFANFETLNLLSRWRLEFHRAALLMFESFPWMGVGQGNFFKLSTIFEFTQSNWLANSGGNNAHNYFLQTLAETGIIGMGCFTLIFVWPFFHVENRKKLISASVLIISVFLGNLYSHSLLIRENLLLLAVFIGLMYAHAKNDFSINARYERETVKPNKVVRYGMTFILLFITLLSLHETIASFNKMPFIYNENCYAGAKEVNKCNARQPIKSN